MSHSKPFARAALQIAAALFAFVLAGCNAGSDSDAKDTAKDFKPDPVLSKDLQAKGVPADFADFFASAKFDTSRVDANTVRLVQTYPNGATREISMKLTPDAAFTPTAADSARVAKGGKAIYGLKVEMDSSATGEVLDISYIIPNESLPDGFLAGIKSGAAPTAVLLNAAIPKRGAAANEGHGVSVYVHDLGHRGADVALGSALDYAHHHHIPGGGVAAGAFAIGSAANSVSGSAQLSQQHTQWQLELADLLDCAQHPTNQVARSEAGYSARTSALIQNAQNELDKVTGARFLNQMDELATGINPILMFMSVPMKAGFTYNEETLRDYSENTIMREARLAVVSCKVTDTIPGNVEVFKTCTEQQTSGTVETTVKSSSGVNWVWSPDERLYVSYGTYKYERKVVSRGKKTCTRIESSEGLIDGSGRLTIIDEQAAINVLGFDYEAAGFIQAEVPWSEDCEGTTGKVPDELHWLPGIFGFAGGSSVIEGERVDSMWCKGTGVSGTATTKYHFVVPPGK